MVGFWYPKCGRKQLEKMWREQGLLDSRRLHGLKAGMSNGLKLPVGLGFYIAPSNCQGYYANHFNKLAPEANAEFTDHWAMRDNVLVPTFTFFLRALRKLELNEQILIDYGPDFATMEPHEDQQMDMGGDPVPAPKKLSKRKRDGLGNGKQTRADASTGPMPNTPPCTAPADGD